MKANQAPAAQRCLTVQSIAFLFSSLKPLVASMKQEAVGSVGSTTGVGVGAGGGGAATEAWELAKRAPKRFFCSGRRASGRKQKHKKKHSHQGNACLTAGCRGAHFAGCTPCRIEHVAQGLARLAVAECTQRRTKRGSEQCSVQRVIRL